MLRRISFLAGLVLFSSIASAQFDFTVTGGYSHMYPEHSGGLFFDKDGAYGDLNFAFKIPQVPLPTFVGVGFGASGYWESHDGPFFVNNNNFGFNSNLYSNVENYEIEPRLAFRFTLPGTNFFIRPQIGAGLLINYYGVDNAQTVNNVVFFNTLYHTGAAFDVHPDVEAGFAFGPASFGMDAGYLAAWGSFGQLGDHMQELHVGLFARFKY